MSADKASLPRVMTPKMVAEFWDCSERHVYALVASGELRSFKVGAKLIRILSADVLAHQGEEGTNTEPAELPDPLQSQVYTPEALV